MDIRQLEYFLELSKTKNFRKASEQLHVSQPALSKSIRQLEEDLGTVLIERTNKSFELTDTGEVLVKRAAFLLEQFNDIYKEIDNVKLSHQGEIKIGVPNILGNLCYFELICEFQKKYPGIHISVIGEGTKDINDALRNETIDLGIGMLSGNYQILMKDLRVIPLTHDHAVLVVNKERPYSSLKSISISELRDEKFIMINEQFMLYDDSMRICSEAGFTPNVVAKSSQWDFVLKMVESGFGVTMLPGPLAKKFMPENTTALTIEDGFDWDIGFMLLKTRPISHAMEVFIQFTFSYLKERREFEYVYYLDNAVV